ncbi:MAG: GTPase HflX [bacterium]
MIEPSPQKKSERALLVGLQTLRAPRWRVEESLDELGELVKSAGGEAAARAIQRLDMPTAAFYIGKGKAQELTQSAQTQGVSCVIFDDELSPAQVRNLEKMFACKVIDRTQLILDVFAQRAQSREGKLQIELAQLLYLLPRLTRMWTHLSRQSGGIGTRGPGETQLEVDRRRVQEKIHRLERELKDVRRSRAVQRAGRARHQWPVCALVGYTNAGKSTLMNRLTAARVYTADKLFATLDPTIRQCQLPNRQKILISDTVGFLRKLPHHLVESFQATLEEVVEADLLIHVVDVSHPLFEDHMRAVEQTLEKIHASDKRMLTVFNKIDCLENAAFLPRLLEDHPYSVNISAKAGQGMDAFFAEMQNMLQDRMTIMRVRLPQTEGALLASIHSQGRIIKKRYAGNDVILTVEAPLQLQAKLKPHILARL